MKHIMLLFLSEVHVKNHILSDSVYHMSDGTVFHCVQTNESAVKAVAHELKKKGERLNCIFYFLTKKAKQPILFLYQNQQQIMTHAEVFLQRVSSCADTFQSIDFDEDSTTDDSIRQIIKMADKIETFIKEERWDPEDVQLHADMTGGLRHASMMMLTVMQLLKYKGIHTTEVDYSNWKGEKIENVTEIYRMFNLISGADEFVNFGSVKEIDTYMQWHTMSHEMKKLLQAMHEFTDTIRICRTGQIKKSVANLRNTIDAFQSSDSGILQERIFKRILEIFKLQYGSLLTGSFTDIDIIRWCIDKGYLQQAMTLCTEWLPTEIIRRKIIYTTPDIVARCEKDKKSYHSWQLYFLVQFNLSISELESNVSIDIASPKEIGMSLRKMFSSYLEKRSDPRYLVTSSPYGRYATPFFDEMECHPHILDEITEKVISSGELQEQTPILCQMTQYIYTSLRQKSGYKKSFSQFLRSLSKNKIISMIITFPNKPLIDILKIKNTRIVHPADSRKINWADCIHCDDSKWNTRQKVYMNLLTYQVAFSDISTADMLSILYHYYHIRTGRNSINHASDEVLLSTDEITDLMRTTLQEIESIPY